MPAPKTAATHTVVPFACHACDHQGKAAVSLAGRTTRCPGCGGRVLVPPPPADPPSTVWVVALQDTTRIGPPPPRRPA